MVRAILRATFVLAISLTLMIPFLQGCGGKSNDEVVATVNGVPIELGYFELKWTKLAGNQPAFIPDLDHPEKLDSLRTTVLNVLINKELIVDRARQEGFMDDPVYKRNYEQAFRYRIIELFKNKEVIDKLPVFTEEDLLEQFKWFGHEVMARHLTVDTESEARNILARLRNKELSFNEAVMKYSTNADRFSGGKLATISFGSNIQAVEETVFEMEKGEISDPVQTPYGYSIFIVDDSNYEDPGEYIAVRDGIRKRLDMRAMREQGTAHAESVLKKYHFKFHWDVADEILALMPDDPTPTQLRNARSTNTEKPILKFTPEQLAKTLWELDDDKQTLQDFSDEYDRLHPVARPMKSARLQGIYSFIHRGAIDKVMPREARARGLDKDPEFQAAMKEFQEQSFIGGVRSQLVEKPMVITDDDIRRWFDENPIYYTIRAQIKCKQIINSEEDVIQDAWKRLQGGESFDDVGEELSIVFSQQWISQPFVADSLSDPANNAMLAISRMTEIGEYTPPFNYQGYWGIMQLHELIDERVMDFKEAKVRAEADYKEIQSNARLDSLLGEWREGADVVIYDKVLAKTEMAPEVNPEREKLQKQ